MIITTLIFIIAFLSIVQKGARRKAALVFSLLTLLHEIFGQGLNGDFYFLTAALSVDALFIFVVVNFKEKSKLTMNLINISFGFIVLNGISWVMWNGEFPYYGIMYETGSMILYFCAIVSLLNWDGVEDGAYKMVSWTDIFRFPHYSDVLRNGKIPPGGKR